MNEENKKLARRSWEIVNERKLDALGDVYTADSVLHEPERDLVGLEDVAQYVKMYLTAFPDLNVTIDDVMAEGDQAVTRWTLRGTHQGQVAEYGPPTGKKVELGGVTIHRIEGSKIAEEWERYDNLSVLQQLGLVRDR